MAVVTLWGRELEGGALPRVCIATGVPTENMSRVTFRTVPAWTYLLLPLGLLPFFIARSLTMVTARGSVPLVPDRQRRIRLLRVTTRVLMWGGVFLFVLAIILSGQQWVGLLWILTPAVLLSGLIVGILANQFVYLRGRVKKDVTVPDRLISIEAHPEFAAALQAWRSQAQPAHYAQPAQAPAEVSTQ